MNSFHHEHVRGLVEMRDGSGMEWEIKIKAVKYLATVSEAGLSKTGRAL